MEIHGAVVGAIIVLICVVPFIIIRMNTKHKEKATVNAFKLKAKEQGLSIDETEIFTDFIVGLDSDKKVFYYQPLTDESQEGTIIELSKIRACHVQKTTRKVDVGGQVSLIMEQLALEFMPIEKMMKPFKVIFYNADDRLQLSGELQSIEFWDNKISNLISK